MILLKCCTQYASKFVASGLEKVSFHSSPKERQCQECSNYHTISLSSLAEFSTVPQFVVIHKVKGFGIVSKAEVDIFLELSCFFSDPVDVDNLISGSSAFAKSSLNIWKFTALLLLLLLLSHFSRVRLCVTPETAAHQAPPSLGFSRQEHWSGLPFPSPMFTAHVLLNPGLENLEHYIASLGDEYNCAVV